MDCVIIKFPQLNGLNLDSESHTSILSIYRKADGTNIGLDAFTQNIFKAMDEIGLKLQSGNPLKLHEFDMCSKTAHRAELIHAEKPCPVRLEWFSENEAVYEMCWEGETMLIAMPQSLVSSEILISLVNPLSAIYPNFKYNFMYSDSVGWVDVEPDD